MKLDKVSGEDTGTEGESEGGEAVAGGGGKLPVVLDGEFTGDG